MRKLATGLCVWPFIALPACVPEVSRGGPVLPRTGATAAPAGTGSETVASEPSSAGETHLRNLRQLTHGGENAEAYWDADGERLIFQSTRDGLACDQIFIMGGDGGNVRRVSTGRGRTTCAYFFPGGGRILYSSTHLSGSDCPPRPDYSRGYVWPLYSSYDIFTVREDGSDLRRLTDATGYDAEATISEDGSRIVFTSTRDGDPELYSMAADGSDLRRLTRSAGYDGGAFYSPDGRKIVFRARHPEGEELAEFRRLIGMDLVRPTSLEIFVMDSDGRNVRQVTSLGGASFCPYWHPDGERIIFASNHRDPRGRNFDLYMVREDGSGLARITTSETFDGFPMFDRQGRRLVFASNRNAGRPGETNVFVAEWRE